MEFPAQQSMLFLEALGGDQDALAEQQQQQHMAAMSADTAYMMMPSMYSVNPLIMESPQASATLAAASTGGAVGAEGRRRSPTDSVGRSGAGADHAQRRATHNAIERARRESLNGQFQDLASAVPALAQVRRPSKATIVEKSLEYIRAFREHMGSRDQYIRKLQQRNMALHDEVNRLRAQLGLELLAEPAAPAAPAAAAAIEEDEEADAEAGGSPHNAPATAPMAMSAPAHSTMQTLPLQKRRQQSLDLGKASKSARRPALRVQTARTTASHAAGPSGEGSDAALSSAAAASPLSAPLLTHPPQLPDAGAAMAARQHAAAAAAAAAAFVAHTNRPSLPTMPMGHLTAAQLGAMGVPMPLGMMTPNLTSPLQVGAMGGYLMAAVPGAPPPPPPFSLMDMAKLSEAFVVSSAAAAAMPLMAEVREPGSL